MVQFNELRITPDGQKLIIDVSVKDLEYYTNVYLDEILIDTQDTFIETGPSTEVVYSKTIEGNVKSVRLELGIGDLLPTLNDNLFFVYVKTKGTPASNTPCGMDNITTVGVVTNLYPLYQQAFGYIKELSDTCIIPKNFINFILQYKALQLAVKTGHYTEAIKFWEKFHFSQGIKDITVTSKCGCYG